MDGMADGTAGMILGYGTVVMLGVGEDLGDGITGVGIMVGDGMILGYMEVITAMVGIIGAIMVAFTIMAGTILIIEVITDTLTVQEEEVRYFTTIT